MINKTNILDTVLERLPKLPVGHYLDVRTYKRNRYVLFVKQSDEMYLVVQNGYEQARFEDVPFKKVRKLFKTLLKKEFPRSTKVRLYTMGEYDEDEAAALARKTL